MLRQLASFGATRQRRTRNDGVEVDHYNATGSCPAAGPARSPDVYHPNLWWIPPWGVGRFGTV